MSNAKSKALEAHKKYHPSSAHKELANRLHSSKLGSSEHEKSVNDFLKMKIEDRGRVNVASARLHRRQNKVKGFRSSLDD